MRESQFWVERQLALVVQLTKQARSPVVELMVSQREPEGQEEVLHWREQKPVVSLGKVKQTRPAWQRKVALEGVQFPP